MSSFDRDQIHQRELARVDGLLALAREEIEKLRKLAEAVDAIRNDIVARQTIGWSQHIYPLVKALGEAGYEGEGYERGRKRILDRIDVLEQQLAAMTAVVDKAIPLVVEAFDWVTFGSDQAIAAKNDAEEALEALRKVGFNG